MALARASQVVRGQRASAQLQRVNASDPDGALPGHPGPAGLYPLLWQVRLTLSLLSLGRALSTARLTPFLARAWRVAAPLCDSGASRTWQLAASLLGVTQEW